MDGVKRYEFRREVKELVQVTQGTQAEMRQRGQEKQKEGEKPPPGRGQQQS